MSTLGQSRAIVVAIWLVVSVCGCRSEEGQPSHQLPSRDGAGFILDFGIPTGDVADGLLDVSGNGSGDEDADGSADTNGGPVDPGTGNDTSDPGVIADGDTGGTPDPGTEDVPADTADPGPLPDTPDPGTTDVPKPDVPEPDVPQVADAPDTQPGDEGDAEDIVIEPATPLNELCTKRDLIVPAVGRDVFGDATYLQTDGIAVAWLQDIDRVEHLIWWHGTPSVLIKTSEGEETVSRRSHLHLRGGTAFFSERRVGGGDIIRRAISERARPEDITTDNGEAINHVRTDGVSAVWRVAPFSGGAGRIVLFDGENVSELTDGTADAHSPVISGEAVAYVTADDGGVERVHLLESGSETFVSSGSGDQSLPRFVGDTLIWFSTAGDGTIQLFARIVGFSTQLSATGVLSAVDITDSRISSDPSLLTAYDVGFGSAVWLEAGSDGEPRVVKRANLASGQVDTLMTYEEDGALHSPRAGDGFTLWILAARRNASFARGVDGEGEFDLSSLMPSGGAYQIESLAAGSGVAAFESGGDVSGVVVVDPRARSFASSVFGAAGFSAELLSDAHADDEDPYHPADFRAIDGSTVLYFHRRPDEADIPHVINYGGCAEGVEPVEQ